MSAFELRPYQKDAVASVVGGWHSGQRSRIVVAPTGAGKTVIMGEVIRFILSQGGRVLVLAHRSELISQAKATFEKLGFRVGIERGKHRATPLDRIVISSMQTMAGGRRGKFKSSSFSHIMIDEAHHVKAPSYQSILDHFHLANFCGVTATPAVGTLEEFDGEFLIERKKLEEDGFLARPLFRKISLAIDLKGAKLSADKTRIADSEAGERIEPHLRELVKQLPDAVGDTPGVVFLPLVATSKRFQEISAEYGIRVEHVDGTTPQDAREAAYERIRSGESQVLSNANLLTEGFDLPALRWVCVLRPVLSRVYYEQAVGRAARIHPGKTHFTVLDPLFLSDRHVLGGLDLMGVDPEVAKVMDLEDRTYDADEIAEQVEMSEAQVLKLRELGRAERERKIAEKLQSGAAVARKIGRLSEVVKIRETDNLAVGPTPSQRAQIKKMKLTFAGKNLKWDDIMSKDQAGRLLGSIYARNKAGLATPAQLGVLAKKVREKVGPGEADREYWVDVWKGILEATPRDVNKLFAELEGDS